MSGAGDVRPAAERALVIGALVAALVMVAAACGTVADDEQDARPGPSATAALGGTATDREPEGTVITPERERQPVGGTTTTGRAARTVPAPALPTLADQLGEDIKETQLSVPLMPPAAGTWRFIARGADGPVAFDACRPIRYRVRIGPGPAAAEALVAEAIARVSAATGLRFIYDGPVEHVPTSGSFPSPNASVSLSEAFAPVVIGWANRSETDLWASDGADTLGVGGPRTIVFDNDEKLSVSGFALLAPSDSLEPGFGPGLTAGNVLLHELGHLIGLDHVEDTGEVMQARLDRTTPDGWGPGDRRGLWELGASRGCASSYLRPG
jgi:hypothetical protein